MTIYIWIHSCIVIMHVTTKTCYKLLHQLASYTHRHNSYNLSNTAKYNEVFLCRVSLLSSSSHSRLSRSADCTCLVNPTSKTLKEVNSHPCMIAGAHNTHLLLYTAVQVSIITPHTCACAGLCNRFVCLSVMQNFGLTGYLNDLGSP